MSEIIFNGLEGKLEGRYHHSSRANAPVALVLHPHPLHNGNMNNKITYKLYKNFVDNDFSVLRFNFRGVGKSDGVFDNGVGELQDATTALNWLQSQNMNSNSYWVSGFSFGAWIALHLTMRRPDIENYILVAPPVTKYDFNFLVPCFASGLIIQGRKDTISKEVDSFSLYEKLSARNETDVRYEVIDEAGHFFNNHFDEFYEVLLPYTSEKLDYSLKRKIKVKRDRRRRRKKKDPIITKSQQYTSPIKPLSFFEK